MTKCDNCIDFEKKLAIANQKLATIDGDKIYYMVALNLSGQRELLETQAFKLINKYGRIKALCESRVEKGEE